MPSFELVDQIVNQLKTLELNTRQETAPSFKGRQTATWSSFKQSGQIYPETIEERPFLSRVPNCLAFMGKESLDNSSSEIEND